MEGTGAHHVLQHFFHARLHDVEVSLICHFHYFGVDVNTRYLHAMLGGNNRCGQADIAQPHKTCFH